MAIYVIDETQIKQHREAQKALPPVNYFWSTQNISLYIVLKSIKILKEITKKN